MTICLPSPSTQARPIVGSPSWTGHFTRGPELRTGSQVQIDARHYKLHSLRQFWESWSILPSKKWSSLPEDIIEGHENGDLSIDASDILFLIQIATNGGSHSDSSDAAIRILGILLDEGVIGGHSPGNDGLVRLLLTLLVDHPNPSRRYHAIKALWQGRVASSANALRKRLQIENHPLVKNVAEQAANVLERYLTTQSTL
jgi:hypothetical protein